jgi:hypothetical protein
MVSLHGIGDVVYEQGFLGRHELAGEIGRIACHHDEDEEAVPSAVR